jgi:CIC family chloride channel protein
MGATAGGVTGLLLAKIVPSMALSPPAMAVIGMAMMIDSATGAVLNAVVMLFEMTRDYNVVLPVICAVAIANAVRNRICLPTIYTLKL